MLFFSVTIYSFQSHNSMSWEVEKHLGQEFHAIDSDSGMVVGKMVLWKMDQSSTMGGWDQSRLEALQFRPVETISEMTIASLSNESDDYSDVVINMVENEDNVEDRAKEKGSPIVEKQVMTPNLEASPARYPYFLIEGIFC